MQKLRKMLEQYPDLEIQAMVNGEVCDDVEGLWMGSVVDCKVDSYIIIDEYVCWQSDKEFFYQTIEQKYMGENVYNNFASQDDRRSWIDDNFNTLWKQVLVIVIDTPVINNDVPCVA